MKPKIADMDDRFSARRYDTSTWTASVVGRQARAHFQKNVGLLDDICSTETPRTLTSIAADARPPQPVVSPENRYNQEALLEMSDLVRFSLNRDHAVGPCHEKLSSFLHAALRDEDDEHPALDLSRIQYARLDKLLNDLLNYAESALVPKSTAHLALSFRVDMSNAKNLRRAWRRRYREQYFMLDQRRCAVIVEGGHLKDVSFRSSMIYNLNKWQTKCAGPVSEIEGNLQFEPGQ